MEHALALLREAGDALTQAQPNGAASDAWLDRVLVIQEIRKEFEEWF
jgi:hypothetical protein